MPEQSPPRRRFQFSLRTLMIVTAAVALLCSQWPLVEWEPGHYADRFDLLTQKGYLYVPTRVLIVASIECAALVGWMAWALDTPSRLALHTTFTHYCQRSGRGTRDFIIMAAAFVGRSANSQDSALRQQEVALTSTRGPSFSLRALTIACTDPEKSARFYRDVLGASIVATDNGVVRWLQLGSLEINLLPNAAESSSAKFPIHAMPILWLEVNDLSAAAAWFGKYSVEVIQTSDGQSMLVADPDGLIIEVWQSQTGE